MDTPDQKIKANLDPTKASKAAAGINGMWAGGSLGIITGLLSSTALINANRKEENEVLKALSWSINNHDRYGLFDDLMSGDKERVKRWNPEGREFTKRLPNHIGKNPFKVILGITLATTAVGALLGYNSGKDHFSAEVRKERERFNTGADIPR